MRYFVRFYISLYYFMSKLFTIYYINEELYFMENVILWVIYDICLPDYYFSFII